MSRHRIEYVEFRPEESGAVVAYMDDLGGRHGGWINLQPGIRPEDVPPAPTPLGALFSTSLHDVPVCTWVPGKSGRRGVEPDTIGVEHASGPKALARLASQDLPLPAQWRWVQDSPRRGLVVRPPLDTAHVEVLDWLLRAGALLTTVPLTGEWQAEIHVPNQVPGGAL